MIRAVGKTGHGEPLMFLGLSEENLTRLTAGHPIRIRSTEMVALGGPPVEVVIHYGRTEQDILRELKALGAIDDQGEET